MAQTQAPLWPIHFFADVDKSVDGSAVDDIARTRALVRRLCGHSLLNAEEAQCLSAARVAGLRLRQALGRELEMRKVGRLVQFSVQKKF